ncbi:hypothetical protein V8F06_007498 [Rhypophila decipiens]
MDRENHEETLNRLGDLSLKGDNDDRNNNYNRNNSNGRNNNDDGNNNPSNHNDFDYESYIHSDDEQFTEKVSHDPGPEPEPEPEPTLQCMICANDAPVSDIFETCCRCSMYSGCLYCRGCLQHLHLLSFREDGRFPPSCCGVPIPTLALEYYLGQEIIRSYLARLNEHAIPADK